VNEPRRHKFSTFTANDPLRANPTTNMPANHAQPPQEAAGGPGVREALRQVLGALRITVTNVPTDGEPHWCRFEGKHDPTCAGMLKVQELAHEALASTPDDAALRSRVEAFESALEKLLTATSGDTWSIDERIAARRALTGGQPD
jgi:hypothetical protein